MQAVLCEHYGPPEVLQAAEVPTPEPGPREIRVRVHASSVNFGDLLARNFASVTPARFTMPFPLFLLSRFFFGIRRPRVKILGSEFSGVVDKAGAEVTQFRPGEKAFGYTSMAMGAYAEFLCLKEDACVCTLPEGLDHAEAAVQPYGAVMAWHILKKGGLKAGERLLVIGASGSMGSAAVQIARGLGARVDGVCGPAGLDFVKALGAERVYNYRKEDFAQGGERYDLIFDVLGRSSYANCRRVLGPDGRILCASFKSAKLLRMLWTRLTGGPRLHCILAPGSRQDLEAIRELMASGTLRARLAASYPFHEAARAHQRAEENGRIGPIALLFPAATTD